MDFCTVYINVQDKNDNAPRFLDDRNQGYVVRNQGFVLESADISTYILRVHAVDKDGTAPNNIVEYELAVSVAVFLWILIVRFPYMC